MASPKVAGPSRTYAGVFICLARGEVTEGSFTVLHEGAAYRAFWPAGGVRCHLCRESTPQAPAPEAKPAAPNAPASGREGGERPAGQKAQRKTRRVKPAHGETTLSPSPEPSPRPTPPRHDNAPAAVPASPRRGTPDPQTPEPVPDPRPNDTTPTPHPDGETPRALTPGPGAPEPEPCPTQPRPGTNLGEATAVPPPATAVSPGPGEGTRPLPRPPSPDKPGVGGEVTRLALPTLATPPVFPQPFVFLERLGGGTPGPMATEAGGEGKAQKSPPVSLGKRHRPSEGRDCPAARRRCCPSPGDEPT
ncbi:extensin-like, partial [Chiloscyllium plagiosum]|uniref:extensin-like n=1 Tax=Chiloscyllium plagiosum TaxID=36176 RepID=UPI001CB82395